MKIIQLVEALKQYNAAKDTTLAGLATESTLSSLLSKFTNVSSSLFGADETVDQSITLDVDGRTVLEVYAKATTATDFHLDVSLDNVTWISSYKSWSGVTEVKEGYFNAFRYIRLRSIGAGVAGDTVDLVLTASR